MDTPKAVIENNRTQVEACAMLLGRTGKEFDKKVEALALNALNRIESANLDNKRENNK